MIFRRSLVRELTATAIGLFVVLLAILFTNLVLRLLARAAGGTRRARGNPARCSASMPCFIFNILLSVALFLTVLLTLSRWYRDSEMIVWFTSGQSLAVVPAADPAVRSAISCRDRRSFVVPVAVGRAASSRISSGSSSRKDEIALMTPGLFREFRRANLVVFVESINSFDGTIRNVFLHSVDEGKDATTVARARHARGSGQRRPFHRARGRAALRGQARFRRFPDRSSSRSSAAGSSRAELRSAARCRRRRSRPPTLIVARRQASSAPSCSGGSRCRSRR